ncbi:nitroreductase family deazaflavin-dependent oxidoreductase [Mycobacterium malmoense]|uniref:Deazaflavin-dependent nitroreductase n=1 Tax=Mycobacterium malmoense TaxID=1780 RepID=A0ABX3SY39_MYCMA|nr:nitroreductase family deazaflavin-dependent oxidoreductase [Mycobacterium malmoense]ORA85590.1 deazaflavin-dependent nitroreductase [Mycobacterium malmoense]QZA17781.1 nitroreductase family deazaflavin-dependent oxidoreductase [Mycobacterium malmoense]UNB94559.1 nitroreductase family deazaflavin-dependent oxidoreductase [Mycobacterium malmoense]
MSDPRPPAWLKPMNKLMMAVQKLGIVTGPVRVLTVSGRKSGEPRSTPATPFALDDGLYVVGGYPRADWVLNARAAGTGTVTRGRKSERVSFVELTAEQARPVLRAFPGKVPRGVGFFKRSGLVQQGTADEFEALAGRCAVFRLDTVSTA